MMRVLPSKTIEDQVAAKLSGFRSPSSVARPSAKEMQSRPPASSASSCSASGFTSSSSASRTVSLRGVGSSSAVGRCMEAVVSSSSMGSRRRFGIGKTRCAGAMGTAMNCEPGPRCCGKPDGSMGGAKSGCGDGTKGPPSVGM